MWPAVIVIVLILLSVIVPMAVNAIRKRYITIQDYEIALRMRDGRVLGRIEAGRRFTPWREEVEVTDGRNRSFVLPTQEVMTKDSLPVKVSTSMQYCVNSPERARASMDDAHTALYRLVQIALRDAVSTCDLEALLADRSAVSATLQERLGAEATSLGMKVERAVILDVSVRGELKSALGEAVKARAEARANLERARGETAVLRNLANAAKMLREHGGLYELRALETAQKAAASTSNTLVLGLQRDGFSVSDSASAP